MPTTRSLYLCAAAAVLAGACGQEGTLGQVDFGSECADGDESCFGGGLERPLAVGAVLPVDVQPTIAGAPSFELQAADDAVIQISGNEMIGLAEGRTAVLAVTDGDLVLDFIHVWVATPTRMAIRRLDRDADATLEGPLQLLVGDELDVDAVAFARGLRLVGRFDSKWSVSGDAVRVLDTGEIGRERLVATTPGTVELSATVDGHQTTATIEVLP